MIKNYARIGYCRKSLQYTVTTYEKSYGGLKKVTSYFSTKEDAVNYQGRVKNGVF